MKTLYKFFIGRILKWVAGLTGADFEEAVRLSLIAEGQFLTSETKREYVMRMLKKALPIAAGWALNLLLESAVSYVKRTQKPE